ncbi:hypothetical protein D918_04377 [Trichuris suis]|nr:hypothetical protein D918_04377 [Trichuris suis]
MDGITLFGQRLRLSPKSGSTHSLRESPSMDRLPAYPGEMRFTGGIPLYDFAYAYGQRIIDPINASNAVADGSVAPWPGHAFMGYFDGYIEDHQQQYCFNESNMYSLPYPLLPYGMLAPSSGTYRSPMERDRSHSRRDRKKRAHPSMDELREI